MILLVIVAVMQFDPIAIVCFVLFVYIAMNLNTCSSNKQTDKTDDTALAKMKEKIRLIKERDVATEGQVSTGKS